MPNNSYNEKRGSQRCSAINFSGSYLVLELTNQCVLNCDHCIQKYQNATDAQHHQHNHFLKKGFMSFEMIKELLDDLDANKLKFDALVLFWLGEPLMHPEFTEIYRHILERNAKNNLFKKIEVHTNAVLLNDSIISQLFEHPDIPQIWHFSLDAIKKETYAEIKGKDYFGKVYENVDKALMKKAEAKALFPRLVFQFIVRPDNHSQALMFKEYWFKKLEHHGLKKGVCGYHVPWDDKNYVFFRQLDNLNSELQSETDAIYFKLMDNLGLTKKKATGQEKEVACNARKYSVCSGFFKSPVVNWDGSVTVCTRDSELKLCIGNLNKNKFSEIWWKNRKLDDLRMSVIKQDYSSAELCQECIIPQSSNYSGITEDEISDYLKLKDD